VEGGWVPIVAGTLLFIIMNTWTRGRIVVSSQVAREHRSVRDLQLRLESPDPPARAPGTAVFLASSSEGLPRALWHNLRYNNVIHEQVILVTIMTEEIPRVSRDRRLEITEVLPGIVRIVARSGFMETPNITTVLHEASKYGVRYNPADTTFFVGNESVFFGKSPLKEWEKRLFAFLLRNSRRAASFYRVPENRLVEFGARIAV
jgi:KUP system potassium uptake protein